MNYLSAKVFVMTFGVGYAITVFGNYPLFRYYPLVKRFSLQDLVDPMLGPAMAWYGWIFTALVPAVILAAIIPKRFGDRIPTFIFWILPFVILAASWYREREWFF